MIDFVLRYQASIFVDSRDIIPSAEIITKLVNEFKDKNMLPSTFKQMEFPNSPPSTRLRLSTSDEEWIVNFALQRIDVIRNSKEIPGKAILPIVDFCSEATTLFSRILTLFPKKAKRLSLISSYLLEEMSLDALKKIFLALYNPITFYQVNCPNEWNSRVVSKVPFSFGDTEEQINVVTEINKINGEMGSQDEVKMIERLQVNFDINTVQDNQDFRFVPIDINSFYGEIVKLEQSLLNEIGEYICQTEK